MPMDYTRVHAALKAAAQVEGEMPEAVAEDVAFHMTDWLEQLDELYKVYQDPDGHSNEEVIDVTFGFLTHAPNHIAAAKKLLTDVGVRDIFGVGAVEFGTGVLSLDVEQALTQLIGEPLSIGRRRGATLYLDFGQIEPRDQSITADITLCLECPWRLDGPEGVVTGSEDMGEHPELDVPPDDWEWDAWGNLCDHRVERLLGERDSDLHICVNRDSGRLVVTGVQAQASGEFALELSGGYSLHVFPARSREESWRLLRPGTENHFVFRFPPG